MITKVTASNFLSWAELEFDVPPTIALIEGWNFDDGSSEGSGKSAILNAICWGLYGCLPKAANIDDVVRDGEKGCVVELQFSDGTKVVRSRKPNALFMVSVTGDKILGKDAKETQTLIETYVGLTFETFCQTSYFAQNYGKKFVTATNEEKSKILAEVQDLTLFDKARKLAKERAKAVALKNSELRTQYSVATAKLAGEQKLQAALEKAWENEALEKARRVQALERSLASEAEKLADLENRLQNIPELKDAKAELQAAENALALARSDLAEITRQETTYADRLAFRRTLETVLASHAQFVKSWEADLARTESRKVELEAFLANPVAPCPTCGTTIEHSDVSDVEVELRKILGKITSLSGSLDKARADLAETEVELAAWEAPSEFDPSKKHEALDRVSDASAASRAAFRLVALAEGAEELLALKQATKKALDNTTHALEIARAQPLQKSGVEDYRASQEQTAALEIEISEISEAINATRSQESSLLKLAESFVAVKNQVFESLLGELNYRVADFLATLFEVPIRLEFQNVDQKIELSLEFDGQPRGLGLLSGGQFRRVNLAVDLALADIIHSRKNSKLGLLMIDEYMKDLSEESMYKCLDLLKKRNMPILLIEHNSIIRAAFDSTYKVELREGVSAFSP